MLTASLLLVARRTAAHARLLSAVVIGVVLAVTVMASSAIYFDSLRNIALDRSLDKGHRIYRHSFDMLGEAALTAEDAERYMKSYRSVGGVKMPFTREMHQNGELFQTDTVESIKAGQELDDAMFVFPEGQ